MRYVPVRSDVKWRNFCGVVSVGRAISSGSVSYGRPRNLEREQPRHFGRWETSLQAETVCLFVGLEGNVLIELEFVEKNYQMTFGCQEESGGAGSILVGSSGHT